MYSLIFMTHNASSLVAPIQDCVKQTRALGWTSADHVEPSLA